jgi:DNA ligase-associated metallophosphoesterase
MERTMNVHVFDLHGETLHALPSGALFWPSERVLAVSDLHLGKAERAARRGVALLPPYEGIETLTRLAADIATTAPRTVICLGDSFDDSAAADALDDVTRAHLPPLMAGRSWIWIEGNHDPGPVALGGTHLAAFHLGGCVFRHIARQDSATTGTAEISGHYHPKVRVQTRARTITRRCFLVDDHRVIMPAYGTYTGGLYSDTPELDGIMAEGATAILLGTPPIAVPMPRRPEAIRRSRGSRGSSG